MQDTAIATLDIEGKPRKVVMQAPKNGFFYIPIIEMGALIGPPTPGVTDFTAGMGVTLIPDADLPGSRRSFLKAWNPSTQQPSWTVELPGDWPGSVLATAGDLVFQGRMDGQLVAYDAKTGEQVWSIGGTDKLPPLEMPALVPPADPDFSFDPERVKQGGMAFATYACLVCHGMNAIGGGAAPDLRYSPMIVDAAAFKAVVKDGVLKLNGMPPSPHLPDEQLEAIRTYLRALARQAAAANSGTSAAHPEQISPAGM